MHSSRMRTSCSLTVSRSLLLGGSVPGVGGCLLLGGVYSWGVSAFRGVSVPGGMSASGGVSAPGVVCFWWVGCLPPGGRCLLLAGGVCLQRVCIPACTEADTPAVNRITDMSKNITLATTSLQPVIMVRICSQNLLIPREFI